MGVAETCESSTESNESADVDTNEDEARKESTKRDLIIDIGRTGKEEEQAEKNSVVSDRGKAEDKQTDVDLLHYLEHGACGARENTKKLYVNSAKKSANSSAKIINETNNESKNAKVHGSGITQKAACKKVEKSDNLFERLSGLSVDSMGDGSGNIEESEEDLPILVPVISHKIDETDSIVKQKLGEIDKIKKHGHEKSDRIMKEIREEKDQIVQQRCRETGNAEKHGRKKLDKIVTQRCKETDKIEQKHVETDKITQMDTSSSQKAEDVIALSGNSNVSDRSENRKLFNTPQTVMNVNKTYSRKSKDGKGVKRLHKVKEWLKSMPEGSKSFEMKMTGSKLLELKVVINEKGDGSSNEDKRKKGVEETIVYSGNDFDEVMENQVTCHGDDAPIQVGEGIDQANAVKEKTDDPELEISRVDGANLVNARDEGKKGEAGQSERSRKDNAKVKMIDVDGAQNVSRKGKMGRSGGTRKDHIEAKICDIDSTNVDGVRDNGKKGDNQRNGRRRNDNVEEKQATRENIKKSEEKKQASGQVSGKQMAESQSEGSGTTSMCTRRSSFVRKGNKEVARRQGVKGKHNVQSADKEGDSGKEKVEENVQISDTVVDIGNVKTVMQDNTGKEKVGKMGLQEVKEKVQTETQAVHSIKHKIFKTTRSDSHPTTETSIQQSKGKLMFRKIEPKKVVETSEHKSVKSNVQDGEKSQTEHIEAKSHHEHTGFKVKTRDRNIFEVDLNSSGQESDPYEFKSSQKTPQKTKNVQKRVKNTKQVNACKSGQICVDVKKQNDKSFGKSILKKGNEKKDFNKGDVAQKVADVIEISENDQTEKRQTVSKLSKLQTRTRSGKKSSPKFELTQKDFDDMEQLKDKISEAEDYDLITASQVESSNKESESIIAGTCQEAGFVGKGAELTKRKLVTFHQDVILIGDGESTVPLSDKDTRRKTTVKNVGAANETIGSKQRGEVDNSERRDRETVPCAGMVHVLVSFNDLIVKIVMCMMQAGMLIVDF